MGNRIPHFQGTEVRGLSREDFAHGWNDDAGINDFARRLQREVQIHRVIDGVTLIGVGRSESLEDVEIHFQAVRLLVSGRREIRERLERLPVIVRRFVATLPFLRAEKRVLILHAFVRAIPVVVRAEIVGRIREAEKPRPGVSRPRYRLFRKCILAEGSPRCALR